MRVYVDWLWDEPETWDWMIQTVCTVLFYYIQYAEVDDEKGRDENGNKNLPMLFYDDGSFETCFCDEDDIVVPIGDPTAVREDLTLCEFGQWLEFAKRQRMKWEYLIHPEEYRCEFLGFLKGLPFKQEDETLVLLDGQLDRGEM